MALKCDEAFLKAVDRRCYTLCKRFTNSWRDAYVRDINPDYNGHQYKLEELDSGLTLTDTCLNTKWMGKLIKEQRPRQNINAICVSIDASHYSIGILEYEFEHMQMNVRTRTKRETDYQFTLTGDLMLRQIATDVKKYASDLRGPGQAFINYDEIELYLQCTGIFKQNYLGEARMVQCDPHLPYRDLIGVDIVRRLQSYIDEDRHGSLPVFVSLFCDRTVAQLMHVGMQHTEAAAALDFREIVNVAWRVKDTVDDESCSRIINANLFNFGSRKSLYDNMLIRRLVDTQRDHLPRGVINANSNVLHWLVSQKNIIRTFSSMMHKYKINEEIKRERDNRIQVFNDLSNWLLGLNHSYMPRFCLEALPEDRREIVRCYGRSLLNRSAGIMAAFLIAVLFDNYMWELKNCPEGDRLTVSIVVRGYVRCAAPQFQNLLRKYMYRFADLFWPARMPEGIAYRRPKFMFLIFKKTKTPGLLTVAAARRYRFKVKHVNRRPVKAREI
ncbi:MAG: hypothetical protein MHMPM18_002052 [Marteilia pararefringens]